MSATSDAASGGRTTAATPSSSQLADFMSQFAKEGVRCTTDDIRTWFRDNECDIDAVFANGATALVSAVHMCREDMFRDWDWVGLVSLLVRAGANVNVADTKGTTATFAAVVVNHLELLEVLFWMSNEPVSLAGPDHMDGITAFEWAILQDYHEPFKFLLNYADLNHTTKLGCTAVMFAAARSPALLRELLTCGKPLPLLQKDNLGRHALAFAIEHSQVDSVRLLVEHKFPVDERFTIGTDRLPMSPLMYAIDLGDKTIIRTLLELDAHVLSGCESGHTPLMMAAAKGDAETLTLLFRKGGDGMLTASDGESLLHASLACDNVQVWRMVFQRMLAEKDASEAVRLLTTPTQTNGQSALERIALHGSKDLMRLLLNTVPAARTAKLQGGVSPLMVAAAAGHVGAVTELCHFVAPLSAVDDHGWSALLHAARWGHVEVASALSQFGCDPNIPATDGLIVPMCAAYYGHSALLSECLWSRNAYQDLVDDHGRCLLHHAVSSGDELTVTIALAAGSDVDCQQHDGSTPLHLAVAAGHWKVVDALLRADANFLIVNNDRKTPAMLRPGDETFQQLLDAHLHRIREDETPIDDDKMVLKVRSWRSVMSDQQYGALVEQARSVPAAAAQEFNRLITVASNMQGNEASGVFGTTSIEEVMHGCGDSDHTTGTVVDSAEGSSTADETKSTQPAEANEGGTVATPASDGATLSTPSAPTTAPSSPPSSSIYTAQLASTNSAEDTTTTATTTTTTASAPTLTTPTPAAVGGSTPATANGSDATSSSSTAAPSTSGDTTVDPAPTVADSTGTGAASGEDAGAAESQHGPERPPTDGSTTAAPSSSDTAAAAGTTTTLRAIDRRLLAAAAKGQGAKLGRAIQQGANVDCRAATAAGHTPLAVAAAGGHLKELLMLIIAGAHVNMATTSGKTPLIVAATFGHRELVSCLLDNGALVNATDKKGKTALEYALALKQPSNDIVSLLLFAGAQLEKSRMTEQVTRDLGRVVLDAATRGQVPLVRAALAIGAPASCRSSSKVGHTPLTAAISSGQDAMVSFLASRPEVDVNERSRNGRTPLMVAVLHQDAQCLMALVSSGRTLELDGVDRKGNTVEALAARDETGYFSKVVRYLTRNPGIDKLPYNLEPWVFQECKEASEEAAKAKAGGASGGDGSGGTAASDAPMSAEMKKANDAVASEVDAYFAETQDMEKKIEVLVDKGRGEVNALNALFEVMAANAAKRMRREVLLQHPGVVRDDITPAQAFLGLLSGLPDAAQRDAVATELLTRAFVAAQSEHTWFKRAARHIDPASITPRPVARYDKEGQGVYAKTARICAPHLDMGERRTYRPRPNMAHVEEGRNPIVPAEPFQVSLFLICDNDAEHALARRAWNISSLVPDCPFLDQVLAKWKAAVAKRWHPDAYMAYARPSHQGSLSDVLDMKVLGYRRSALPLADLEAGAGIIDRTLGGPTGAGGPVPAAAAPPNHDARKAGDASPYRGRVVSRAGRTAKRAVTDANSNSGQGSSARSDASQGGGGSRAGQGGNATGQGSGQSSSARGKSDSGKPLSKKARKKARKQARKLAAKQAKEKEQQAAAAAAVAAARKDAGEERKDSSNGSKAEEGSGSSDGKKMPPEFLSSRDVAFMALQVATGLAALDAAGVAPAVLSVECDLVVARWPTVPDVGLPLDGLRVMVSSLEGCVKAEDKSRVPRDKVTCLQDVELCMADYSPMLAPEARKALRSDAPFVDLSGQAAWLLRNALVMLLEYTSLQEPPSTTQQRDGMLTGPEGMEGAFAAALEDISRSLGAPLERRMSIARARTLLELLVFVPELTVWGRWASFDALQRQCSTVLGHMRQNYLVVIPLKPMHWSTMDYLATTFLISNRSTSDAIARAIYSFRAFSGSLWDEMYGLHNGTLNWDDFVQLVGIQRKLEPGAAATTQPVASGAGQRVEAGSKATAAAPDGKEERKPVVSEPAVSQPKPKQAAVEPKAEASAPAVSTKKEKKRKKKKKGRR